MKSSLIFKFLGAFLLVIAISTLLITLLISRSTEKAFTLYTTKNGKLIAEQLAPQFANYYQTNNGWQGIDEYLENSTLFPDLDIDLGRFGRMMGQSHGNSSTAGGNSNQDANQRLILADANGLVIYDSQSTAVNQTLKEADLQEGEPILVDQMQIGTLIITNNAFFNTNSPAGQFLSSVKNAIVKSAILAAILSLLIGTLFFVQITSPLRKLTKATDSIANGNLSQNVDIHSQDEIGRLAQSINTMSLNLQNAQKSREHLMADVAHELRTPLAAIQATIEGIQDGIFPADDEQINAIYSQTTVLNRLIEDLRLLTLAEAGQLKLEKQPHQLNLILQQISESYQAQAKQHAISLEVDLAKDLPEVDIDSDRFTQIITNLLSNSFRYTPLNGKVILQTRYDANLHQVQTSITDTGSGIDPASLSNVFDRFYRGDKSRTRSSGGSGLGLAIAKQLVESHGGNITVVSPAFPDQTKSGPGTRFTISLPEINQS
jgi:signal transduction histidine kinase